MKGRVLWFDSKLGYGFLRSDETGEEIYFHWSEIMSDKEYKTAFSGEPVEFDKKIVSINEEDKPLAYNIKILERKNDKTGKPILLVAYANMKGQIPMNLLHYRLSRYANAGLTHINDYDGFLVSADHSLNIDEVKKVVDVIKENYDDIEENISHDIRKVFETKDFQYDIIFL